MQKDLRGAESQYAGLPGFESQRCNPFAGLRTTYTGHRSSRRSARNLFARCLCTARIGYQHLPVASTGRA